MYRYCTFSKGSETVTSMYCTTYGRLSPYKQYCQNWHSKSTNTSRLVKTLPQPPIQCIIELLSSLTLRKKQCLTDPDRFETSVQPFVSNERIDDRDSISLWYRSWAGYTLLGLGIRYQIHPVLTSCIVRFCTVPQILRNVSAHAAFLVRDHQCIWICS